MNWAMIQREYELQAFMHCENSYGIMQTMKRLETIYKRRVTDKKRHPAKYRTIKKSMHHE